MIIMDLVERAKRFAIRAHQGQKRLNGRAFILHPLMTQLYVQFTAKDSDSTETNELRQAAALTHDTVEVGGKTLLQIERALGEPTAYVVGGLTRMPGVSQYDFNEGIASSGNPDIIIVRCSDFTNNWDDLPELYFRVMALISKRKVLVYEELFL